MNIRDMFAERFGEGQAAAIEDAAVSHENGVNSERKGSDSFKWALLITIGYECWSKDAYREHHGITAPADEIKAWVKEYADLASHAGDFDYLTLLSGGYNEYMPEGGDS